MVNHRSGRPGTRGSESALGVIYALSDPRSPYDYRYVGRTTWAVEDRVAAHVRSALSRLADGSWRYTVTHKIAWLRALERAGCRPVVTVLATVPREDRIFEEQKWIAAIREAGHRLTNATGGGEGPERYKPSDETRRRQSESGRRRYEQNPQERDFYRRKLVERLADPAERQKLSEQAIKQWSDPAARVAQSLRLKEACRDPELRSLRSARMRALLASDRGKEIRAQSAKRIAGEKNPCARLTWEKVREIRARYVPRVVTHSQLAAEFGVVPTLIGMIIRGQVWADDPQGGSWSPPKQPYAKPARQYRLDDDHLRQVARIYREAIKAREFPVLAVARHFAMSVGGAGEWVRRCRKAGVLGPTRPGLAGEFGQPDCDMPEAMQPVEQLALFCAFEFSQVDS